MKSRFLIQLLFLCFCTFLLGCGVDPAENIKKKEGKNILLNPSIEFTEENSKEYHQIIDTLEKFLRVKDNDYPIFLSYIKNDRNYFRYPFQELYEIDYNYYNENNPFKPTLLALTRVDENRIRIKLGWFAQKEGFSVLKIIYNFLAVKEEEGYKFENILAYNTREWEEVRVGTISYLFYPGFDFDKKNALEFNRFNKNLADFWGASPIHFTYFLSHDVKQSMEIRGFDFHPSMFYQDLTGGITFTYEQVIFAGNNSEIYKHELIHLYTYWYLHDPHRIIDEGICTLFGGSKGLTYEQHLKKLKKHLKNNEIDVCEMLFYSNYVLDKSTSLLYTGGAFLCDLTLQKCGKEALFDLFNAGESTEELREAIEFLFGIEQGNFNTFFREELAAHTIIPNQSYNLFLKDQP